MVEDEEEAVEERCVPASRVLNGAAVKLVRHLAHTGAQVGGGLGTDLGHLIHLHPHKVRVGSSGLVK